MTRSFNSPDPKARSAPSKLVVGVWLVIIAIVGLASPALAQDDEGGQGVVTTLRFEDESGEDVFVVGAVVTVEGVGDGVSDENGVINIPVPEAGEYTVTIDATTLPAGVSLRVVDRASVMVLVEEGQNRTVLFALQSEEGAAAAAAEGSGIGRRLAQLSAEGLKQGLYLAMASIGLSLIYGTTGLVNFAHAEMVTWGGLATYFFNFYGLAGVAGFLAPLPGPFGDGVNLVFAIVFGMIAGGVLGYLLDRVLFRRLRRQGVGLIAQMVITIGLSIVLRYLFLYFFGGGPRSFRDFSAQTALQLGPVQLVPKDIIAMSVSIGVLLMIGVLLTRTQMGKAMRAVSDNKDLAESSGIDVQRVIATVWVFGAAAAALGGAFFALDQAKWDFGFRILLLIFSAVTLGGLGTAYGALLGALVIGMVINLSTLVLDAELKNMVALLVMVLVLMFRPQGLLGRSERIG